MEPLAAAAQTLPARSQSQVSRLLPPLVPQEAVDSLALPGNSQFQVSRSQDSRPPPHLVPKAGGDSLEVQLQKLASTVSSLQKTVGDQSKELADLRSLKRSFEAEKEHAKRCKTSFCEEITELRKQSTTINAAMAWHKQTLQTLFNLAMALSVCLPDWHGRWKTSKAAGIRVTYEDRQPI